MLLENYIMVALSMGFGDIKHVDEVCCQPAVKVASDTGGEFKSHVGMNSDARAYTKLAKHSVSTLLTFCLLQQAPVR
ncbi:hypothetical protein H5410_047624 [Solanum commersonii]|uniref:Uncharacterized protein n=1 Tax=Solanum commersonii TaxID=4109 RepID=A0A9J5XJ76_SOLCO|nr:hypothetical protein H5410_047624 [Solanum commersonii]